MVYTGCLNLEFNETSDAITLNGFVTTERFYKPVAYLNSNVQIVNGNGSKTNPYILD